MKSLGSIWQKWDLHVHTPASYHWTGQRFEGQTAAQQDALCKAVLDAMNDSDVVAFCIMDYWTFEGFIKLREYVGRFPGAAKKRIFPGIEFRMAAATNHRLNTHVILSDDVSNDSLTHFISHLKLADGSNKPPTKEHLIELGKNFDPGKLQSIYGLTVADRSNEPKMLKVGLETALITRESVVEAIQVVGKERCLVMQPYDTSDGLEDLDWKRHPYTDSYLMKWADCFEAKDPIHVDLFLGRGIPGKPHIGAAFLENIGGYPKPVFRGSDAHKTSMYGVYPNNRITWLKAQPTFKGLKQVCHEPPLRCHIGERPEKLVHVDQNPTKYIKRLKIAKVAGSLLEETWFDGQEIELNPGLVAIIGNKGSGKSALADIIALAGNTRCKTLQFLNKDRFRVAENKAKDFNATLTWMDGTPVNVRLDADPNALEPERVRYLPQHYIEELCNEIASGDDTHFGREVRKVIFSHVPPDTQMGLGTLDELIGYLVAAHRKSFAQIQQKLASTNATIVQYEIEISEDSLKSYRSLLALKQQELEAHEKNPVPLVAKPVEDPEDAKTKETTQQIEERQKELSEVQTQLAVLRTERTETVAREARLERLIGHVDNFEAAHEIFVEENGQEFEDAGFTMEDIISVKISRQPIIDAAAAVAARLMELDVLIEGKEAEGEEPAVKGLESREREIQGEIEKLQNNLKASEKAYQTYLAELNSWNLRRAAIIGSEDKPDTIEYLNARIKRATEFLPGELVRLREERRQLVRDLHAELLAERNTNVELYKPVQKIANEAAITADSLKLEFEAFITPKKGFEENFFDFIHRNKKGTFYGEEESKQILQAMIQQHDFNSTDSVVAFVDALMKALTSYEHDGKEVEATVQSQLKNNKDIRDLYDFIFGLDYLDIRYTLRLSGKDISQLSPGEKGALLLVFYLLLDSDEIPIIIDQPEHNLDNESVVSLLVDCIRKARSRRQVFIVTHNPNLAVYCDADQVICSSIDKTDGHKIEYKTGAIEDYDINCFAVNVLEGTYAAFDNRRKKWQKPLVTT